MAFQVYLVFEDGKRELEREFDDLEEAAIVALRRADEIGLTPAGNGHGPPTNVEIYSADRMELSIQIMRGGLNPSKGVPRSQSK